MARRAAKTDTNQRSIVQLLRAVGCRVAPTHMVGEGFPDAVCYDPVSAKVALVEIKDGAKVASARKLTPAEEQFHAEWDGAPLFVVASDDDALAMLDTLRGL